MGTCCPAWTARPPTGWARWSSGGRGAEWTHGTRLAHASRRIGGDGWESNPPGTAQHRPTDGFEDRERHQPPNIPSEQSLALPVGQQVGRPFPINDRIYRLFAMPR